MVNQSGMTMRERHLRNAAMLNAQDVIVAAYPASGAALLGNVLMELGHSFVDPHLDEIQEDGRLREPGDEELRRYRSRIAGKSTPGQVGGRRFFKNHLHPDHFRNLATEAVVLLVRDPRDALYSSYRFFQGFAPTVLSYLAIDEVSFLEFLEEKGTVSEPAITVDGWVDFYRAWAERAERAPRSAVVRFEELKTSPADAMTRLLETLGLIADRAAVERAVERSSFERMRAHEEEVAGDTGENPPMIMRRGQVGEWREWFGDNELSDRFRVPHMIEAAARFGYRIS
ncbi:sulfotransferase domain-containing protein [Lentzea sp.]|uniref:sulfotransferase domain-containing protein n=1 Tax=Lentzea sp. TaxID=56099 RepID=UPI002C12F91C|nr:sulfotransferase domain-containing protein [Lentzea sp.]HUQ60614.1 sulfotransferase domain-containing protein [Lentzea sp.]